MDRHTNVLRLSFTALIFAALIGHSTDQFAGEDVKPAVKPSRLLFVSQGKTGIVNSDGSGLRYFDFKVPNQATWQPGPIFPGRQDVIFLSMEPRRDGPGKPFAEYFWQTPTHLWRHDVDQGSLEELCTKGRKSPHITPQLLLGDNRLLIQVVGKTGGQIVNVRLDGSDPRQFTKVGEGLPYGFSLSPDGRRVAFHLASPQGYQVWTADPDGTHRIRVAAQLRHLYFGTNWSPDGKWVVYVDCLYDQDPGHDWADVCIGRADGSEHRVLTTGQAMWFGATYGDPKTRGGGSNIPQWTREGKILFPRRAPNSNVAWEFQAGRPDIDHFNRDFKPELARGGTSVCRLDPQTGRSVLLTPSQPGIWEFRTCESPDGRQIAFCRAATGKPPELWVVNADGSQPKLITRGTSNRGVDHPRWLPGQ